MFASLHMQWLSVSSGNAARLAACAVRSVLPAAVPHVHKLSCRAGGSINRTVCRTVFPVLGLAVHGAKQGHGALPGGRSCSGPAAAPNAAPTAAPQGKRCCSLHFCTLLPDRRRFMLSLQSLAMCTSSCTADWRLYMPATLLSTAI